MKKLVALTIGLLLILNYSCTDKEINVLNSSTPAFSFHSSKCLLHGISSFTLADTGFTYTFTDKLVIDFSTRGNCCPDSDRFTATQRICDDTIIIAVTDTARNLCYCDCPYMIHTEIENLPHHHYVVRCEMTNWDSTMNPIHLVDVYRQD
jgi:hypothetical protein